MSDIKTTIKQDYGAISKRYDVFGVFCCGNQNYGLPTEKRYVDTKAIVVPSFKDLVFSAPVSETISFAYGKCEIQDIRELVFDYKKQNIASLETLFTDYCYLSPKYKHEYDDLLSLREEIARIDERRTLLGMKELLDQTVKKMVVGTRDTFEEIDEHGYHKESLMNAVKTGFMIDKYAAGRRYASVLDCSKYAPLGKSFIPAEKAKNTAKAIQKRAAATIANYLDKTDPKPNAEISKRLDIWLYYLIKASIPF